MKVVISQPMFFPWRGIFEQMRLSDVFVHYDDAQLPQGRSLVTRVEIKTPRGVRWLTMPVRRQGVQLISEARIDNGQAWRDNHLKTLAHCYARSQFSADMLALVGRVYAHELASVAELNIAATEAIAGYLGLTPRFARSSEFPRSGRRTERLRDIVRGLNGTVYVTGHGARNYLDHELLEENGIRVEYMDYQNTAYPQPFGLFTPYVTVLDLIANMGPRGRDLLVSGTLHWKEFVA